MNLTFSKLLTTAFAFALSALTAGAVSVTIPNASFETPSSPATSSTNHSLVSGWFISASNNNVFGTASITSNFLSLGAASGNDYVFIDNTSTNNETITSSSSLAVIAPLTTYTLTVAIGNVKLSDGASFGAPGNVSFSLLANGVSFATQSVSNGTVPNGTFEDFSLTYVTPATSSIIGEDLTIQLASQNTSGGQYQPAFDNVTLDATALAEPTAAPEPGTLMLLISSGLTLCWWMRRRRLTAVAA
jgi:hypothetical protein